MPTMSGRISAVARRSLATHRKEYIARYGTDGVLAPGVEPLVELAAHLAYRLAQVTAQLQKDTKRGQDFMIQTVRGAWTAHPLLGHERELSQQLRTVVVELNKRLAEKPAEETPADRLNRMLPPLRSVG